MFFIRKSTIKNDFFSLLIAHKETSTAIIMKMILPLVNTRDLPFTSSLLQMYLPAIYTSKCFNEKKLSFLHEVKKTEIGHLFEHILLEYIYALKIAKGQRNILVKGETSWNWEKDPHGMFHITINIGQEEKKIFYEALTPSLELLRLILESRVTTNLGAKLLFKKASPPLAVKKEF